MSWNHNFSEAPRDGSRVLLWTTTRNRDDEKYVEEMLEGEHLDVVQIGYFDNGEWICERIGKPTHWQPLPFSPNNQSDGDAFAAVKGKARLADHTKVEPSLSDRQYLEKIADQVIARNKPKAETSREETPLSEAGSGADASKVVCRALIDDVGGQ